MDMDFAVSCPLVRHWRLVSGFCSSTRTFDPCFFQTSPRGGSPCIITRPSPPSGWPEDLHLQTAEHAQHTTKPRSRRGRAGSYWGLNGQRRQGRINGWRFLRIVRGNEPQDASDTGQRMADMVMCDGHRGYCKDWGTRRWTMRQSDPEPCRKGSARVLGRCGG